MHELEGVLLALPLIFCACFSLPSAAWKLCLLAESLNIGGSFVNTFGTQSFVPRLKQH